MSAIRLKFLQVRRAFRYAYAWLRQRAYNEKYRLAVWEARHRTIVILVILLLLIVVSYVVAPAIQRSLEPYFADEEELERLRSFFLALGSALIGATAIAFSLVMFAMQVNVERMPHGLFRKLSSDRNLLGAFLSTFFLAVTIVVLTFIPGKSWLGFAVSGACWGLILILILLLYAYRRALSLINPLQQLSLIIEDTRREMRVWVRRARRSAPLLEPTSTTESEHADRGRSTHDTARMRFFQINPHWTARARQSILYSMSFARRYAELGDHEVSGAALTAVVAVNAEYIKAKGKTFFARRLMIEDPSSTDSFINESLEHLQQNMRIGVSRKDEQQIEQTFKAIAELVQVYLGIDYSTEHAPKTHAHLAARYLSKAVQSIIKEDMADVIMEGVRLMGQSAQLFLAHTNPNDIATLVDDIGSVASAGIAKEDYRAITLTGMEQFAGLTFNLIRTQGHPIHFAARKLSENVSMVVKLFVELPDAPLENIHSTFLGPYYSPTNTQSLGPMLTQLTNVLLDANVDDEAAQSVIQNIKQWAEGLYQTEKDLFLKAIR